MIIATGCTGFIGRRLIRQLSQSIDRNEILCLVHDHADSELERTGRANLDALGIRYIPVDLVSGKGLENVPRSPEIVLHLASNTDTGSRDHSINDVGAKNLIEAISPLPSGSKFIFTSTISVSDHRTHPDLPGDETSQLLRPYSEYGRKKLKTEAYLAEQARAQGFSLSILRVCAVYGNGTRKNGLFDMLVHLAKRNSILSRLDYPGRMTMMHVDDIADVLIRMMKLSADQNPRTLIAHGEVLSVHEMSAAIYESLGKTIRPIKLPKWFWRCTQGISYLIYAMEPILPHAVYNKLWQLTLLVNNGYNNVSVRLRQAFPDKEYADFKTKARDLLV